MRQAALSALSSYNKGQGPDDSTHGCKMVEQAVDNRQQAAAKATKADGNV